GVERGPGVVWARPVGHNGRDGPLFVYSLLIATVLGTMGLPHILVRFYPNPDGPSARLTTVRVLGLLGIFYLFPTEYGLLGRVLAPGLYVTGQTDSVVLRLPHLAWPGVPGNLLSALTAAGAFAAFLSTASGLLVSIAGTLSYDVWGRVRHSAVSTHGRRVRFRICAVASVPIAFITMIVVSLLDSADPVDAEPMMLALHAPEGLGLEELEQEPAAPAGAAREPTPA